MQAEKEEFGKSAKINISGLVGRRGRIGLIGPIGRIGLMLLINNAIDRQTAARDSRGYLKAGYRGSYAIGFTKTLELRPLASYFSRRASGKSLGEPSL